MIFHFTKKKLVKRMSGAQPRSSRRSLFNN